MRLRDVVVPARRRHPGQEDAATFTYIDIDAVDNHSNRVVRPRPVMREDAPSRATNDVRTGDVLFSLVRPYLRNVARVAAELDGGVASSAFCVLRPSDVISSDYLFYALLRPEFIHKVRTYGESPPSARDEEFLDLEIPVAPRLIQPLVVRGLEAQLSRLDAAEAGLHSAAAKLRRYRLAVLNAAVSGELVMPSTRPRDGRQPWPLVAVGDLATEVRYGTSVKCTADASGVPVLRMGNIVDSRLSFRNLKYLPAAHREFPELLLRSGDVLFNRTNSPELVGKAAVFCGSPPECSFASYLIRVRTGPELVPDWLVTVLSSSFGRRWVAEVASQQVGQANVNGSKLKQFRLPLPSIEEQDALTAEVTRRLSLVDALTSTIDVNVRRSAALRHRVLRDAFSEQRPSTALRPLAEVDSAV
jgi:type I restriction enzyme S subunit